MKNSILTINCSETSIKFSLYDGGTPMTQVFYGAIESVGAREKKMFFTETRNLQKKRIDMTAADQDDAVNFLLNWLEMQEGFDKIKATGHRVAPVQAYENAALITPALLYELKTYCTGDSEYRLAEITLIEIFATRYPTIVQIACFEKPVDVHSSRTGDMKEFLQKGTFLQGYGFHSFSFGYLMEELNRIAGSKAAQGRVILVHLGTRKSLAAFKNGKSINEDVDFTAPENFAVHHQSAPRTFSKPSQTDGGSWWFATHPSSNTDAVKVAESNRFQNATLSNEEDIEGFCYETRKWIGSFAAALGGIDTLVFTGGIGEHAPEVRSEVCDSLAFLGIELNEVKNMKNERLVSTDTSPVTVRVVQTNEALIIARMVADVLDY